MAGWSQASVGNEEDFVESGGLSAECGVATDGIQNQGIGDAKDLPCHQAREFLMNDHGAAFFFGKNLKAEDASDLRSF